MLLLISVNVEAQVSRMKMEGGVGFSSMHGMDLFNETVHPFYFTVGAEYLDRGWFHLASNIGVVRKGGKDELWTSLDEASDWSLMGTFLTLNTLFDIKKVSYDGYTFYAGAGPVVNIKVGKSEKISSESHDESLGMDFNPVHLGVRCEVGVKKDFSCLITNASTDLNIMTAGQCFPLYWYEDRDEIRRSNKQASLFEDDRNDLIRHDGISDYALSEARKRYGDVVSKQDIFYYIYGYLHSQDYRDAFADDLRLSLPRIGFVDSKEDFDAFADAGRRLADLHLDYEHAEKCGSVKIDTDVPMEVLLSDESLLRVTKMKLIPDERRLVYNQHVTIEDIPEDAFRYIVNGRSALGWIVDQYQYSVDKESGIVNDPNEYAGPKYIFDLVLSIITVSIRTMEIVDNLPRLTFSKEE